MAVEQIITGLFTQGGPYAVIAVLIGVVRELWRRYSEVQDARIADGKAMVEALKDFQPLLARAEQSQTKAADNTAALAEAARVHATQLADVKNAVVALQMERR